MRIPLLGLALLFVAGSPAAAQEPPKPPEPRVPAATIRPAPPLAEKSQDELTRLRDEKLGKAVFGKAPWVSDYDQARAQSEKTGKPIFAYFTRSYAY